MSKNECRWVCKKCHKAKTEQEVEAHGGEWPFCCDEAMLIGVVLGTLIKETQDE
jgi:hypothetical protein